jgi:hypothetical protein
LIFSCLLGSPLGYSIRGYLGGLLSGRVLVLLVSDFS